MQKKAQVWIESVLYTLIGLAVIGLLLAVTRPKILQTQDQFVIQQTIRALNEFNNKIIEVKQATGNRRIIQFQLSKGELTIDGENERIEWRLQDSNFMYSEPGSTAQIGALDVLTEKAADKYDITLALDYKTKNDLLLDNEQISRTLQPAKTPYSIIIENAGQNTQSGLLMIDIIIE
jgi:type II secretory pathway pseudopilin PulG